MIIILDCYVSMSGFFYCQIVDGTEQPVNNTSEYVVGYLSIRFLFATTTFNLLQFIEISFIVAVWLIWSDLIQGQKFIYFQ